MIFSRRIDAGPGSHGVLMPHVFAFHDSVDMWDYASFSVCCSTRPVSLEIAPEKTVRVPQEVPADVRLWCDSKKSEASFSSS